MMRRRPLAGLLVAVSFFAALLVATPAHSHSSVGSEAACAACSLRHQTPSLDTAAAAVVHGAAPELEQRPVVGVVVAAGFESPSRPRSPPFTS